MYRLLNISIYVNDIEYLNELVLKPLCIKTKFSIRGIVQAYSMQIIFVVFGAVD